MSQAWIENEDQHKGEHTHNLRDVHFHDDVNLDAGPPAH